jgi:glycosyltransferase involved in cell wall biosynthesis
MPKVSVVTSVYNGEAYLKECVDSILSQTFKDFEYIILNNGSNDRTAEILNKFTDPRLKIVHQENLGIAASLNKGVKLSRCNLIARLDADDYSLPKRLEKQVTFMDQHPEVVVCGSRFKELFGKNTFTQSIHFIETDQAIRKSMSLFNPLSHSATIFRRKAFLESGGYNGRYKYAQDYDLWVRILNFGEARILKDELGVVRMSVLSESNKNARKLKIEALQIRWKAFCQFGGNRRQVLYYFLKSLTGLIFTSKRHLNR